jgi:hypothetical protein
MPVALRSLSRKPKPRKQPESDPRFVKVMTQLKQNAAKVKQHPTPAQKAAEAQAAAKGPPNEKAAGAKAKQVDKIKDAKTKKPESNSFLALLRAEIAKAMPQTLGDTEKFMKGGDAGALKGGLKGNVAQQKQEATGDVSQASKQTPSESGVQAKQEKPIPPEAAPPNPDVPAAEAMPAPKADADVSVQDSKQDTEAAMKDAEVTPDQLKKANDPRFSAVLSAKDQVGKQADAAPAQYRAKETGTVAAAAAAAKGASKTQAAAMLNTKNAAKSGVLSKQAAAKAKDEAERKKVTDTIEGIYNKTKQKVEEKLNGLETEVNSIFDAGTDAAINSMKAYVEDKLFKYKLERYLSIPVVGAARWIKDQFMGLPDEVNAFYAAGKTLFTSKMDALVVRVANLVETRLSEAKGLVAAGQAEIKTYVAGLSPNLRSVGQAAQKEVAGRFEELEKGIEEKKNQLAQALAQKYKEASERADKALKDIQDANKGLVAAFVEKLGEIIKILAEFKDKLMAILRKGADTIKLILADPIGFLSNLIAAIKQGISQFVGNIWTHLKAGFMKWLFGALAEAGIEIPAGLPSLPSILKLVLSVLGLTYERMRAKAVKLLGPVAVTLIEKAVEYVRALISGGPAALWEKVKADLSSLKAMVIDAIQSWLIETVIKQAVVKLLSMFNPAGAIVQAIMMIYSTVMFLIERASQIMEFVNAVINSVHAIATGAIGGAAAWIERSLANAIPIVIGFLAALIGLGGLSKKIKETINKVQGVVDKAIDKAIGKVIEMVKKLFAKLFGKKDGKPDERTDAQKTADLTKGVDEGTKILEDPKVSAKSVAKKLPAIQKKYKLTTLEVVVGGTSGNKEMDYIEASINPRKKGKATPKAKEMEMVTVDFKPKGATKDKEAMDTDEFERQLRIQRAKLNTMTIADWLANRAQFFKTKAEAKKRGVKNPEGRDPAGNKVMEEERKRATDKLADKIFNARLTAERMTRTAKLVKEQKLSYADAAKLAEQQIKNESRAAAEADMAKKVPLHRVDQIAGGAGTDIAGMGDSRINSAIGAGWTSKSKEIEAKAKEVPEEDQKTSKIKVTITMNGKPV